ncbi:XRE family transcriptional regulator [Petralouisia muris]|uniref:XRE family transcriptional regulator n=1 Tax=Petralouisia muris TaxID=3032872 RepID=A0AC61RQQ6_9FIRM|nr:helix-turn-helix transcriptional regulator [Petralouisia muris]TGY91113.1 XRE family transcriptional regulator [Petralouisia muris]
MQKPDKSAIGERIRRRREELNMSREQLSEIIGITSKFLSDIELGVRGFSLEKLLLFSEYLNLSTEYILFGTNTSINERIFLQSINKCPEEKKAYLLSIINKIVESYST